MAFPEAISACGTRLSDDRFGSRHRDPDDPERHPRGAHRAPRRAANGGDQQVLKARSQGRADAFLRVPWDDSGGCRAGRTGQGRSPPSIGGDDFRWATSQEERSKAVAGAARRLRYAALALRPGSASGWATDVCVPISRLADCINETKADLAQSSLPSALAGHVGDGNFHLIFMIDPNRPEEIAEASRLNDRMVTRARRWTALVRGSME